MTTKTNTPAVDPDNGYFTVVYKVPHDWRPGDDIMLNPMMTAVSWSHALDDRDRAIAASHPTAGDAPIYQVQFVAESGTSAWHDASKDAYDTFMPERRRIVYAAPVSAGEAGQVAKPDPLSNAFEFLAEYDEIRGDEGVYTLTSNDKWMIRNFLIELAESAAAPADRREYLITQLVCAGFDIADRNVIFKIFEGDKPGAAEGASKP